MVMYQNERPKSVKIDGRGILKWMDHFLDGLKVLKWTVQDYESWRNGSVKVDGFKARDKSFVWKDSGGKNIETLHEKSF